jgi:hypothetical protein
MIRKRNRFFLNLIINYKESNYNVLILNTEKYKIYKNYAIFNGITTIYLSIYLSIYVYIMYIISIYIYMYILCI